MTREQAKANLIGFGITEPTTEQIDAYLNQIGGEIGREKTRAERYKTEADKAAELKAQLDALNEQNMSELDKAKKAAETSESELTKLRKELEAMKFAKALAEEGITGEDADAILSAIDSGDMVGMISRFGSVIKTSSGAAASAKEQELLNSTKSPEGASGSAGETKSTAETIAAKLAQSAKANTDGANSVLSHYLS